MKNPSKLNSRGDSIIEVLIVIAILMIIISGGYTIATRSLNGIRASQERSEATKIAEGQIEAINQRFKEINTLADLQNTVRRGYFIGYRNGWAPPGSPDTFCVNSINGRGVASTDPVCTVSSLYKIGITTDKTEIEFKGGAKKYQLTYTVTVSWDKVGGGAEQKIDIVNRYTING